MFTRDEHEWQISLAHTARENKRPNDECDPVTKPNKHVLTS